GVVPTGTAAVARSTRSLRLRGARRRPLERRLRPWPADENGRALRGSDLLELRPRRRLVEAQHCVLAAGLLEPGKQPDLLRHLFFLLGMDEHLQAAPDLLRIAPDRFAVLVEHLVQALPFHGVEADRVPLVRVRGNDAEHLLLPG